MKQTSLITTDHWVAQGEWCRSEGSKGKGREGGQGGWGEGYVAGEGCWYWNHRWKQVAGY